MGYGQKTDYKQGITFDLDKTYQNLIKPVCKTLKMKCFRANDVAINGSIDKPMYDWIYQADIVIADISTLNANALYELGVRHALRPFSTIVIAEKKVDPPFDVDHTVINFYEHLGKDIGVTEAQRFKKELKKKMKVILNKPTVDSPVYTYLPKLIEPKMRQDKQPDNIELVGYPSISDLVEDA